MSRKRHFIVLSATMATVAWAAACGDGSTEPPAPPPDPPRPTTVTVTPATADLAALGETVQLRAEVRDQNGQVMAGASVSWASSATSVATVDGSGLVTAAGNGTATITASAGGASGTATVTVAQEVSTVALTPAVDTLVAGDTLRLTAEAADVNGHVVGGAEFAWASGDTAVAVVDATGLVTGVGAGEVEITATLSGVAGRAALVVAAPAPTTVAVTPDTVEITALGDTLRLVAEVRDQLGRLMEHERVAWDSGNTLVATVDSTGLVTTAANGTATITAIAGIASGTAFVTVMQSVASVEVLPSTDTVAVGDTLRLTAQAFDRNGRLVVGTVFTWSSNDGSVATVDTTGLTRGIREGTATITATTDSAQGTAKITVANPDRAALEALYRATDGPNWSGSDNWLTDAPLDEWYGVETDEIGRVTDVALPDNSLAGPLPPEIGELGRLTELQLRSNELTGAIPAELGMLTRLEGMDLTDNRLTGPIPPAMGNLAGVGILWLVGNQLTGPVPPELGNLSNLWSLNLYGNELTGSLPTSFLRLGLIHFDYGDNEGLCAPGTSAFLTWLQEIESNDDSHFGRWPRCNDSDVAVLASLYHGMGGTAWTNSDGWLGDGVVSDWHGIASDSLGHVTALDLKDNGLSGQVPASLSELTRLTILRINGNDLSGRLPLALAALSLREFRYTDTEICTPANGSFREWLKTIESHEGTGVECGFAFVSLEVAETAPLTSIGATVALSVTGVQDDGTRQPVDNALIQWQSYDPTVATVSEGVVTAVRGGNATITATYEENTAESVISVWTSTLRQGSVRVLYVAPADREFRDDYSLGVSMGIVDVQAWYREQLDGLTFDIYSVIPERCQLPRVHQYYDHGDVWEKVLADIQSCAPVEGDTERFTWVLYVDVEERCGEPQELGRGGAGLTMMGRGDLDGLSNPSPYSWCGLGPWEGTLGRWRGGTAHELGHAFHVPHPPGCEEELPTCDHRALMWNGYEDYPDTYLRHDEKVILRRSPFIKR